MSDLNLEEIKKKMDELVEIADTLPEKYQQKGFEVLLSKTIDVTLPPTNIQPSIETIEDTPKDFIIPIDVRAYLRQYDIPESALENIFLLDVEDIKPVYTITESRKSRAQIQVALLSSLETALRGNKFEFSIEDVREKCRAHKSYDRKNFMTHFRNSAKYFNSLDDSEHIELTPDGKSELADIVLEFVSDE